VTFEKDKNRFRGRERCSRGIGTSYQKVSASAWNGLNFIEKGGGTKKQFKGKKKGNWGGGWVKKKVQCSPTRFMEKRKKRPISANIWSRGKQAEGLSRKKNYRGKYKASKEKSWERMEEELLEMAVSDPIGKDPKNRRDHESPQGRRWKGRGRVDFLTPIIRAV